MEVVSTAVDDPRFGSKLFKQKSAGQKGDRSAWVALADDLKKRHPYSIDPDVLRQRVWLGVRRKKGGKVDGKQQYAAQFCATRALLRN